MNPAHHSQVLDQAGVELAAADPLCDSAHFHERVAALRSRRALFEKIEIEVNIGCNRRCSYCFLASDRRERYVATKSKTMDWDLYCLLIEQLSSLEFRGIACYHFYAEPLLNPNLPAYVAHAASRLPAVRFILYTNGDYLSAALHTRLTDAGITVFVVTRHDNEVPAFLQEVLLRNNVVLEKRADMSLNNRGGFLGAPVDERVRSLPCIYTSEAVVVTIDGEVLPCSCDFRQINSFGNIRNAPINEIYESETCRRFRHDLLAGRRADYELCRECDYYCGVLSAPSAAEPHRQLHQPTVRELHRSPRDRGVD